MAVPPPDSGTSAPRPRPALSSAAFALGALVSLTACGEDPLVPDGEIVWATVSAGAYHTCALTVDGEAWCWGANDHGQLGVGSGDDRFDHPVKVNGSQRWISISAGARHTCGVDDEGRGWCWGLDGSGQLGNGPSGDRRNPGAVLDLQGLRGISAGAEHSCAVDRTGRAWCWGGNASGQLGDGTRTPRSHAVAVEGDHAFATVSAGGDHTCGLAVDGQALCWGENGSGQLGTGTGGSATRPATVSGRSRPFESVSAGASHTCAVTREGQGWCWGDNSLGQVAPLDGAPLHGVPRPVLAEQEILEVRAGDRGLTCAIAPDGRWSCWGGVEADGRRYTLGGVLVFVEGPPPSAVSVGGEHACVVLEGEVWCWGAGGEGQLGTDASGFVDRPAPVG